MLRVHYLHCVNGHINQGSQKCISFGGVRADQAVSAEILKVIQPVAIDAALLAAEQTQQQTERIRALQLELEQAKYEARLAARRYDASDPENRLVTSELEARWNVMLCKVQEVTSKLNEVQEQTAGRPVVDRQELLRLAEDLPAVWDSSSSDVSLKQRITRILITEIVANVDDQSQEIVLIIHWVGGRHSELRVPRAKSGQHERRCWDGAFHHLAQFRT
jgi:hypothetical protein